LAINGQIKAEAILKEMEKNEKVEEEEVVFFKMIFNYFDTGNLKLFF
jgi:hypothetical protein